MISARLKAAAEFIRNHEFLADCGTDHGYLPIYVLQNNYVKRVIASDNKLSPLKNAEDNILYLDLEDRIELKLAEGLSYLNPEIDVVSILGMGGRLIAKILDEADLSFVKRLVLSPNSEAGILRDYLMNNHWKIVEETFLEDKNKYYQIIAAEAGEMVLTEVEKEFGPKIIKAITPTFTDYIEKQINKLSLAVKKVNNPEKQKELHERIALLKEVIN